MNISLKRLFVTGKHQNKQIRSLFTNFFNNQETALIKHAEKLFGKYDIIIDTGNVSEKLSVPTCILRPEYADTGIPKESLSEPEIKNDNQVECMRQSCTLAKQILRHVRKIIKPGITTDHLDKTVHELIVNNGAYPSPLNYKGFPKSVCTSINNVACHGIPDDRPLKNGDILNIDITVYLNGFHGDCSDMFEVGEVDDTAKQLIYATDNCLKKAIDICKPNEKFCSIGQIIQETAHKLGFTVVPAFAGHGIGTYFHGPPSIFHMINQEEGIMKPGMTFTIEPVISQGTEEVLLLDDGWTAVTADHARTAQIEHTILITNYGCDILTL